MTLSSGIDLILPRPSIERARRIEISGVPAQPDGGIHRIDIPRE
jgi:hypothetical protein